MHYFPAPGKDNTHKVIDIVANYVDKESIDQIVVASTTGYTINEFVKNIDPTKLICATHSYGFSEPGQNELSSDLRSELAEKGVTFVTATHLFRGVGDAVSSKFGGLHPGGIISRTLKLLGEGCKVCVECAVMATDAGYIPPGTNIVSVGGTSRGADTAIVMKSAHASDFFDIEIGTILCKPETR